MENKINIAKLLKDCPSGMELDCTLFNNVTFERVTHNGIWINYLNDKNYKYEIYLDNEGCLPVSSLNFTTTKCIIFPKGKTTWEGFIPPCKFKDGDVCYVKTNEFKHIFIFKVSEDYNYIQRYVNLSGNHFYADESHICTTDCVKEIRFATEEEKQKLFDAIKANGYRWNAETKILEKLIEPKFKIEKGKWYVCIKDLFDNYTNKAFCKGDIYYSPENGYLIPSNSNISFKVEYCIDEYFKDWTIQDAKDGDVIFYDTGWTCIFKCIHEIWYSSYCFITDDGEFHIGYKTHAIDSTINGNAHIATKEQCNFLFQKIKEAGYKWNSETKTLEKLPKFKEGDEIKHIKTGNICEIIKVCSNYYIAKYLGSNITILFDKQDKYKLVPKFKIGDTITNNKFTIKITNIDEKHYYSLNNKVSHSLPIEYQDEWKLVIQPIFKKGNKVRVKGKVDYRIINDVCDTFYTLVPIGKIDFTDQDNWELVIEPIFKVGNKIKDIRNNSEGIILKITGEGYECQFEFGNFIVSFKDQNNWKLIPKFKKGDNIKHKESSIYCTIGDYVEGLKSYHTNIGHCISDNDVDNWELVSDKFNINTLVPFESKVLIRNAENQRWIPAFWGCRCKDGYITTFGWCKYCIPFEYNSDLMNSTLDCSNYFKTWE